MKSVKGFVLSMLALYLCLFFLDYLKAKVFPVENHALLIWIKTFLMVGGGILIMKMTLQKNVFKTFLIIYAILWVVYYLMKWIAKFPDQPTEFSFSANKAMLFYLNVTQLLTPFPFFFFWVLNRVFKEVNEKAN